MNVFDPKQQPDSLVSISDKTRYWYICLLALTFVLLVLGIILKTYENVIISVPVICLLLITLIRDKKFIHVPPILITIVVISMILALVAGYTQGENKVINAISDIMIGVVLSTGGMIIAYIALGKLPGFAKEKPALMAIESFSIALATDTIWIMLAYLISENTTGIIDHFTLDSTILHLFWVAVGAALTSSLFFLDIYKGFYKTAIIGFLDDNSGTIGIDDDEIKDTKELIETGESFDLEFKSTIRTNLKTGEKDKRMEKAVLKTLVAFLNSDGGTLLVGVEDNGNILGVDLEGFDNRDKMNLHITNMLSSQIGDEFIPFIKFKQIDFGKKESGVDKVVIKFTCKPTNTPVFLKDGKQEMFYIRSGPSSVELTGVNLIKYVQNRGRSNRRKYAVKPFMEYVQKADDDDNPENK